MSSFPGVSDLTTLPDTLPDRWTNPSTQLGVRKGHMVEVTRSQSKLKIHNSFQVKEIDILPGGF